MTIMRVHADEWSTDRGYSVAFELRFNPDDPNDLMQLEAAAMKELEQIFNTPMEISSTHYPDYSVGEFKGWVSKEQLVDIWNYTEETASPEPGSVMLSNGVETHFYAVSGHFGQGTLVDVTDWPERFNLLNDAAEESEFCTCGGPGKGFSFGRKNFVNCTRCGKPKPPDWQGEFERASKLSRKRVSLR